MADVIGLVRHACPCGWLPPKNLRVEFQIGVVALSPVARERIDAAVERLRADYYSTHERSVPIVVDKDGDTISLDDSSGPEERTAMLRGFDAAGRKSAPHAIICYVHPSAVASARETGRRDGLQAAWDAISEIDTRGKSADFHAGVMKAETVVRLLRSRNEG